MLLSALREIIEHGLEDMKGIYLSDKVLEDIRAGRDTASTLDDVEKRLGLANQTVILR